jgi:hypothetical protein
MPCLGFRLLLLTSICSACSGQTTDGACRYPEEARALVTDWSGALADEIRSGLRNSPGDPTLLFLVGISQLSKDPAESVRNFEAAASRDSRYPWPHFVLMDIYANLQPNAAKLAAETRAYNELCPSNFDAFRYLSRLSDPGDIRALSKQFRSLLERTTAASELARYKDLWAAEFRSTPPPEFGRQGSAAPRKTGVALDRSGPF